MREEAKVSVIIPIYNIEKYVGECLECIMNQTLREIEIICIDDASTDESSGVVEAHALVDDRIIIIKNEQNRGSSYTRNRGLDAANGKYIYFIDGDDWILPETLQEAYDYAEKYCLSGVYFDAAVYDEVNGMKNSQSMGYKCSYSGLYKGTELFIKFVGNNEKWVSACWQLWRRSYLEDKKIRFYDDILHEDVLFSFMALLKADRVSCLNKIYYFYRRRAGSNTTSDNVDKRAAGLFRVYLEMLRYWETIGYDGEIGEAIDSFITYWYMRLKGLILKSGKRVELKNVKPWEKHLFKLNFTDESICYFIGKIKPQIIERIKTYSAVIIYGAGGAAREAVSQLRNENIQITAVAVTDKKYNPDNFMGIQVYTIEELAKKYPNALIVISAVYKNGKGMAENARQMGFTDIVLLDDGQGTAGQK